MLINNTPYHSIWHDESDDVVRIIDQRKLPHKLEIEELHTLDDFCNAIRDMHVRGAPLIGVTAAFGIAKSIHHDPSDASLQNAYDHLLATRPTAVNLRWAIDLVSSHIKDLDQKTRYQAALQLSLKIAKDDVNINSRIGVNGVGLIEAISRRKNGDTVNILTHCNAGWLATVDRGTATAPIYAAMEKGLDIHVWVDETRPRNQGASLTAWELMENQVPNTLIVDNAGGHLMQKGMVDMVLVGSDRTVSNGDVCNKIGTYLKALSAHDTNVPFYVALPTSTIDLSMASGDEIEIEERGQNEVLTMTGSHEDKETVVNISAKNVTAMNPAFDVTPARLVTGIITENGVCKADAEDIKRVNWPGSL